jgi:hypothetical protein
MDKSIRWENVDFKRMAMSREELLEVRDYLSLRMAREDVLSRRRFALAIKRVNSKLNAPKEKAKKLTEAGHYLGEPAAGRFGGGSGQARFVSGGAPGSKR